MGIVKPKRAGACCEGLPFANRPTSYDEHERFSCPYMPPSFSSLPVAVGSAVFVKTAVVDEVLHQGHRLFQSGHGASSFYLIRSVAHRLFYGCSIQYSKKNAM
jgi:hypothetical protein